jgi:hypothetical protein
MMNGELLKVWGTSSSNLFAVGRNGTIIRYNGSTWQRMQSGRDVDLLDVWGSPDGSVVWACGWEDFKPTVLLRYRGGTWERVYEDPFPFVLRQDSLSGVLSTLWTQVTPPFPNRDAWTSFMELKKGQACGDLKFWRKVADLATGHHEAGYHSVIWKGLQMSSGICFVRLGVTGASGQAKYSKVNKLLLTK